MPTISQLPLSTTVSASDEVPVSQEGTTRAATVGALLASTQPAIIIASPALLGRSSIGPGGPEQVDTGVGLSLASGTLVATGLDHAAFPVTSNLPLASDVVISDQGSPMLMRTSLLRELFSAGQNVTIDANGVISAAAGGEAKTASEFSGQISTLSAVESVMSQDLIAISHAGTNCTVTYENLLNGLTIDQAQEAGPVRDTDNIWAAQAGSTMTSQNFGAIWAWIKTKVLTYMTPVVEIATDCALNATAHNGRLLVCSQPVILTPLSSGMGSGFRCTVVNASAGNVTLGSGFVSSNGSLILKSWQSASLYCANYSAGTITFASVAGIVEAVAVPGRVISLTGSVTNSTTIALNWQPSATGGTVSTYIVQYRPAGASAWVGQSISGVLTGYQIPSLLAGATYEVSVQGQNASGTGLTSQIMVTLAVNTNQSSVPVQVTGLTVTSTSSNAVQLTWPTQTGINASTSFTVQYRLSGSLSWTNFIENVTETTLTITNLQSDTAYEFSVYGLNSVGTGPTSAMVTTTTFSKAQSVTSISWNLTPTGSYVRASGAIGVNAHVSPAASAVQFGFSLSASVPPTNWTAALLVNTDLWGAYLPTPVTPGSWFVWAEGLDGSSIAVSPNPFIVQ